MKARQVKAERTIIPPAKRTCLVCGKRDITHPYGLLRHKECICSRACNDKYLKGEYNHDG